MTIATPIVKWAGGKKAIQETLKAFFPKSFNNYTEPFAGGAAIALGIEHDKIAINDINEDLINVYRHLRDDEYSYVCDYLRVWQESCSYLSESFYNKIKDLYNTEVLTNTSQRSALFIALNKLGYNGLYRVNKKGGYNIPWGKRDPGTKIYEPKKLEAVHEKLQNITLYSGDYQNLHYYSGDFVFLDPPYDVDPGSKAFTAYNKSAFGRIEQKRLADFCKSLRDVKFLQTNKDTEFIRELYADFNIYEIEAPKRISCNAAGRGKNKELIITNYTKKEN